MSKKEPQRLLFRGEWMTVAEIVALTGYHYTTVNRRKIVDGEFRDRAGPGLRYNTPVITHKGVTDTLNGWCKRTGLNRSTLDARLSRGWPLDRALETSANPDDTFNPDEVKPSKKLIKAPRHWYA
jgi:hypothetical protein